MPNHLLIASLVFSVAMGGKAVLAPFYEIGAARVTSPAVFLACAVSGVLFMRRVSWTWKTMQIIAF